MDEVCREMGVSDPTLYRGTNQFVGIGVLAIRWRKHFEDENGKLKRLVVPWHLIETHRRRSVFLLRLPLRVPNGSRRYHSQGRGAKCIRVDDRDGCIAGSTPGPAQRYNFDAGHGREAVAWPSR